MNTTPERVSVGKRLRNIADRYVRPTIPAVLIGALGAVGASYVVADRLETPSVEQKAIDMSPADPHKNELPPLMPHQAHKKMAKDVDMTSHGGGYWVGGYVEDGITHYVGGGDIENPDTYLTAGQIAKVYNFTLSKGEDPDVATHRSVAHSIEMYGDQDQQIKLGYTQLAITKNIDDWNAAGHALGTSRQTEAAKDLKKSNAQTHDMLRQLHDSLPKD